MEAALKHSIQESDLLGQRGPNQRCLPTFLGIGSMRCGSTWLYEALKCHPDIQLSESKELDFFFMPQMLQHDLDWYEAHFAPKDGGKPRPVRGEISPCYARLKRWQVNRIAKFLPNLRLIMTLRHPIERVWWVLHEQITRNHQCQDLPELVDLVLAWVADRKRFTVEDAAYHKEQPQPLSLMCGSI